MGLALIVPEKTVTQKNLTELRSYVITKLRTDQIQFSPTFSKRSYNKKRDKGFFFSFFIVSVYQYMCKCYFDT